MDPNRVKGNPLFVDRLRPALGGELVKAVADDMERAKAAADEAARAKDKKKKAKRG
jgi:hypothetical protein